MAVTAGSRFLKRSNTASRPPSGNAITFTSSTPNTSSQDNSPTSSFPSSTSTFQEASRSRSPFPSFSAHQRQDSGDSEREKSSPLQATQKQAAHKSSGSGEWRGFGLTRTLSLSKNNKSMEDFPFLKRTSTTSRRKHEEHRRTCSAEEEPRDVWEAAERDGLRSWEVDSEPPLVPRQRSVPGHRRCTGGDMADSQFGASLESPQSLASPIPPRSPLGQASTIPPRSPSSSLSPVPPKSPKIDLPQPSPLQATQGSKSMSRSHATLVRVESLQERISRSLSTS